jgi:nicotinamide mononucleotide adenylyltransferase
VEEGFDYNKPTALMVGRYQPFHDGHKALAEEGIGRVGQVCIAVRCMPIDCDNPFGFDKIKARIEHVMCQYEGRFTVISLPNIAAVIYGRDVGYSVEQVKLSADIELISASAIRRYYG